MQGRLPIEVFLKSGLPKLKALDLRQNNFDYDAAALEPLIARCIRGRTSADEREISIIRCFGLPPDSCSAFGNEYRVSTLEPALCVRCADPLITLIVVSSILVAFVLALVAYVYFISRYPRALRRWVSSVSIVVTHIQTLSIISQVFRLRINPPFFCFGGRKGRRSLVCLYIKSKVVGSQWTSTTTRARRRRARWRRP